MLFDNMDYMNQLGETVYLKASPETLYAHLKMGKGVRPLLLNKTPEEVQVFIREQLQNESLSMRRQSIYSMST